MGRTSEHRGSRLRSTWRVVRRVWVIIGSCVGLVFIVWSLWAYRATPEARRALESDKRVRVTKDDGATLILPAAMHRDAGLVFFPGALVDPAAYAPLLRTVALAGYPVVLVHVPRRGAFGGAESPDVLARADAAMRSMNRVDRWIAGGHSLGGVIAARAVRQNPGTYSGLVLVGTSHPRDFSLASLTMPVTQIYGTRDTVADVEKLEANLHNLPAHVRRVAIDGGNHSQFGHYGFQPGDWPSTISRERQQQQTGQAMVDMLSSLTKSDRD